ncbi:MAG: mechanosensitive ion channel family protein [Verrucomicrobiales bacterium]
MNDTGDTLRNGLEAAMYNTMAFLPKAIMFLAILVIGYFLAKFLAKMFDAVLERVGFDRMVERGGIKKALARTKYDASDLLSKLLFYTVFLFVLQLAFGVFGPNPISDLLTRTIAFLPSVFVAIVIVVIASAIAKGVKDIVGSALAGMSYGRLVANAASIAIMMIGIFAALSHVGIAPAIVNGLFYAILAVVVGSAIVSIGGGGIVPMRAEWERALNKMHREAPRLRAEVEENGPAATEGNVREWERRVVEATSNAPTPAPAPKPYGGAN